MAQITVENLSLGYEGHVVLKDLAFDILAGDYLCILGENGAGKSTLIKALLSLHKPSGGRISFGEGLSSKEIGYLTQQSEIQKDFPASVREIVLSGCQNRSFLRPFYTKEDKKLAKDAMEKLGIEKLAKTSYSALSGGQQQRVLLARALCATGKILFLDEPVSGLDPQVSRDFYEIIEKLHREEKVTIVMISHDVNVALHYATKVLHLGEKRFFGTKEAYDTWLREKGGGEDGSTAS